MKGRTKRQTFNKGKNRIKTNLTNISQRREGQGFQRPKRQKDAEPKDEEEEKGKRGNKERKGEQIWNTERKGGH